MLEIGFVGKLESSVDFSLGVESNLLKEDGETAPDLQVTEWILINFYDLLRLAIVSNESFIINPSIKVSGTSFLIRPSGDQHISDLYSLVKDIKTTDEALNDWYLPIATDLIFIQLLEQMSIPGEV